MTLVRISFANPGWDAAGCVADELEEPERTPPRALFLRTLEVTIICVALNAGLLCPAPIEAL